MTAASSRDVRRGLLLSALLLYALNLRGPITAMAPVIGSVSTDLHLTAASAGLLTGLPVLCYALVTPLAATLVNRAGTALAGTATLLGILVGTVLRSTGGFATALVGTVVIGAAITIGNVAVPVVVARDFASGVGGVMGATTAAMNGGAVITTIGMAPLAAVIGWRWALVSWSVVVLVGLAAWWRAYGIHRRTDDEPRTTPDEPAERPRVMRRPLTWLLVVTFAFQSASYYAVSAWLPTLLHDEAGLSRTGAGAAAALFQGFGILGGVLAPLAMARLRPRAMTVLVGLVWLALPVGLLLAPTAWSAWASLGGVAQAANYVVIFTVVSTVAGSPAAAGRMSAVIQTAGYVLAGVAPSALGAIHTASAGWRVPLLVVAVALTLMVAAHTVAIGALVRHRAAVAAATPVPVRD
ncbi:MAG: MFS transporter [Cellulomonas sp. 73-92]|uniref:MFS transporter n=1 Tax=Cellulomonas sp. 73-92 TaxID=1895740 RepID=UPI00092984D6|nr:MFS transporter [Cellulomonas sp. 73-92]OJV78687.1 MAG: MFS transporter [Cellulomonas sp. 73-92]